MLDEELYNVNVDNAFDLLSTLGNSRVEDNTIELGIEIFREITSKSEKLIAELQLSVDAHTNLSSDRFNKMWDGNEFQDYVKLFIAYIIDKKIDTFRDRWMTQRQIEHIKEWEHEHFLSSSLSSNYAKCLLLFIQNKFVYESDWTANNNAREYKLYTSLKYLLFNQSSSFSDELQNIIELYKLPL